MSPAKSKKSKSFSAEERAAMKERARELKAEAEKADGESALLAKIAEMKGNDRAMAKRLHAIVKATAPDLTPKTWYGMPAYARDGKVVCFFQSAQKFKTRYATLGFSDKANLDDGAMWATDFAIKDLTSGFRAVKSAVLKRFTYLLPNTFSYPTTLTLALLRAGYSLRYEPIRSCTRLGKSKIRLLNDGIRFLLIIFKIATLFSPLKIFLPFSWLFFALGLGNYAYTYFTTHRLTNMTVLCFIAGFLFFLLGLISEQIAQLRFDRSEDDR